MLKAIAAESLAASGITIGTSPITGGTNTRVLFDDSGVIGESAGLTYVKASGNLTATGVVQANALAATNSISITGKSLIASASDGVLRLSNNAASDFSLLQFGGVAVTFPALKRSTTSLQARLADDSAFTNLQGKITTDTNATTGLAAGVLAALTTASITVYDATGTAYRVPAITP